MSEIAKTLSCALLVTLAWSGGPGCFGGGGGPEPGKARKVQLFNCTHVNDPYGPPSGHSFKICTRVNGGPPWINKGVLNPKSPGNWTECEKDANEGDSKMTLDLLEQPGKWEILAIKLPKAGVDSPCDDSCDASGPTACTPHTYFYESDVTASEEPVKIHVTEPGR